MNRSVGSSQVVWIHPEAPPKPAFGEPCNGCGWCCLSEPCPLGVLFSRKRRGPCAVLRWDEAGRRYRCGLLTDATAAPAPSGPQTPRATVWKQKWLRRWIAAGQGCDAQLTAEPAPGSPGGKRLRAPDPES